MKKQLEELSKDKNGFLIIGDGFKIKDRRVPGCRIKKIGKTHRVEDRSGWVESYIFKLHDNLKKENQEYNEADYFHIANYNPEDKTLGVNFYKEKF